MKLIDTNGVNYILANNITLNETYLLVPDVKDESEVTELIHNRRLPPELIEITSTTIFREASYLRHYNAALNTHNIRSFFNMSGFGDISIIATIQMILENFMIQRPEQLFDVSEIIEIYTNDGPLTTKINTTFSGRNVVVRTIAEIL